MENDINDILSTKRAWKKGDQDRRKLSADLMRIRRNHGRRIEDIEKRTEYSAFMVASCILIAAVMILIFCPKAHAEDINMDVIAQIESSGNPLAYNMESGAVGLYQITQDVIIDWGRRYISNMNYNLNDMYEPEKSQEVANWYFNIKIPEYLREFRIRNTIQNRIICWNWGIGKLVRWYRHGSHWNKLPVETRRYIRKYLKDVKK